MDAPRNKSARPLVRDSFWHQWFRRLRHNAPVYRHPEPGGPGFWVLTCYEDVVEVGCHPAYYSSEQLRAAGRLAL